MTEAGLPWLNIRQWLQSSHRIQLCVCVCVCAMFSVPQSCQLTKQGNSPYYFLSLATSTMLSFLLMGKSWSKENDTKFFPATSLFPAKTDKRQGKQTLLMQQTPSKYFTILNFNDVHHRAELEWCSVELEPSPRPKGLIINVIVRKKCPWSAVNGVNSEPRPMLHPNSVEIYHLVFV